ncbi:MAG: hypothetical protein JXR96_20445 [Deltaproteobacteria bacterium]|nr:hypothetical protein [Deltaproteobacteria bacterium]
MRTLLLVCMLALITALSAACGGGGPSCQTVCNKMMTCDTRMEMSECLQICDLYKQYMRGNVYDALANCYMDHSCEELEANGEMCFEMAMAAGDPSAASDMIDRFCDKAVECGGYQDRQACVDQVTEDGEFLGMVGMFKDSVLDCFINCVTGKSCEELEEDEAIEACSENCGLFVD